MFNKVLLLARYFICFCQTEQFSANFFNNTRRPQLDFQSVSFQNFKFLQPELLNFCTESLPKRQPEPFLAYAYFVQIAVLETLVIDNNDKSNEATHVTSTPREWPFTIIHF